MNRANDTGGPEPPPTGSADAPGTRPDDSGPALSREGWTFRVPPMRLLLLAILIAAVLWTSLSELRFLELQTTTWDFGVYQQAIWSTSHGRPFYESADVATGGIGSFLQVHSAFVLYALVPVYAAVPSPLTLYVVQSAVVTLAAIPLYLLTNSLTASPRRALGLSVLYLVALPTVGSTLYDFHAESFVPISVFTVAYLWHARRYRWGALAALVGFLTIEVVPVFLFFLAAFFLVERLAVMSPERSAGQPFVQRWVRRGFALLVDRAARPTWLLLLSCIAAYYLLLEARLHYLAWWFGFPPYPSYNSGYVIGATPSDLGLSTANLSAGLFFKASYWLLLFACVAFLPLWYRRSLLLVLPWMAFTFLTAQLNFTIIGFQYGYLAEAPLFLGSAWGLTRIRLPSPAGAPAPAKVGRWRLGGRPAMLRPTMVLFLALVVFNLGLSPADPLLANDAPGAAYSINYSLPTTMANLNPVVALVPSDAVVLASNNLFPLVANDVNAYSMFWGSNPYLGIPFDLANLPDYVLLSEYRLDSVPPWLSDSVYVISEFGLRAIAWSSPAGVVFLFQHGYRGPTTEFGAPPSGPWNYSAEALSLSSNARFWPDAPWTSGGQVVLSVSGATGQLYQTPGLDLPAGHYRISYWVRAWTLSGFGPTDPSTTVFVADGYPFAQPALYHLSATFGMVGTGSYHLLTADLNLTAPILNFMLRGYATAPTVAVLTGAVSVEATG